MAFLRTNYRKTQMVAAWRYTFMIDSANGANLIISFPAQAYPAPAKEEDVLIQLALVGAGTYAVIPAGPGVISGAYLLLSVFASNTSGSWAASKSVVACMQWLIGSR